MLFGFDILCSVVVLDTRSRTQVQIVSTCIRQLSTQIKNTRTHPCKFANKYYIIYLEYEND